MEHINCRLLSILISILVEHGFSCGSFSDVIKPIVKDRGKPNNDFDDFRAIAPNDSLTMLLDYIILDVCGDVLKSCDFQCVNVIIFDYIM